MVNTQDILDSVPSKTAMKVSTLNIYGITLFIISFLHMLVPINNYFNYDILDDDEDVHQEIRCHGELDSNADNEGTYENSILNISNSNSNDDHHILKADD